MHQTYTQHATLGLQWYSEFEWRGVGGGVFSLRALDIELKLTKT